MADKEKRDFKNLPKAPAALASWNPLYWLTLFGPGAIMASLTIGTGELIFSSRAGSIFGYPILFLFLMILILKWTLVFSTARHMVLTGVHPLRRWLELPIGPRGWLPGVLFVFAAICIPIWVSFHASVIGELLASLTGTQESMQRASKYLWGMLTLASIIVLALRGGYMALEKVQLLVVAVMLLVVSVALILLKPDWFQMLLGMIVPHRIHYPEWLVHDPRPEFQVIANRPIWVEASLYVGVIGGASYDYLAYTSFLRDKRWGLAGMHPHPTGADGMDSESLMTLKPWIRAPLIDCTISFSIVFIFSAVFVASGWLVLAPNQQIPGEGSFLEHQAQFVTQLHPWLFPLYAIGTLMAMLGTLYGTIEIAPAVARETFQLLRTQYRLSRWETRLRTISLLWTAAGAMGVLFLSYLHRILSTADSSFSLSTLLIPANLFTGVLSCGIICLLNPWMDASLPSKLRPGRILTILNLLAGAVFLFIGIKGYWDFGGPIAFCMLVGTIAIGFLVASLLKPMIAGAEARDVDVPGP